MSVVELGSGRQILTASRLAAVNGAELVVTEVGDQRKALLPGEAAYAASVAETRARQFAAGRVAARAALARIGINAGEIGAVGRRPVWPTGTVGSIAHTRSLAVAVAGAAGAFRGLGVDVERETAVSAAVAQRLLSESEQAWLPAPEWRTMLFSAKEAVYKAVNPIVGEFLGFGDVELAIDEERQAFRARCRDGLASQATVAAGHGHWARYRAHWIVLFVIASAGSEDADG